jgi:hypothetical protein
VIPVLLDLPVQQEFKARKVTLEPKETLEHREYKVKLARPEPKATRVKKEIKVIPVQPA